MGAVFAFFSPGPMEMVIIGIIAVLLFGKRLPEVGRSLGKGLIEFKKGMQDIQTEIYSTTGSSGGNGSGNSHHTEPEDREEAIAPKFQPPASEPQVETPPAASPADAENYMGG
jgi:sec-independent protein translocase protein TatA